MPSNKKLLQAAAGSAGGDPLYAEDVFSTYLYDGNSSTNVITNGIDLAGEGGLVWGKSRDNAFGHMLIDTVRGGDKGLVSNATSAEYDNNTMITSFNSNGFTLGSYLGLNYNGDDVASWSFRKAEKFFDVQTWTGNSTGGRQIPHSLGSTPGFIITKRTDSADNWKCYHVGNPSPAEDHVIELDNTNAAGNDSSFGDTAPTDTHFTVSGGGAINASGGTYVAYLFASDAGGFGDDSDENIIKCGSFTVSSGSASVTLGYEPQFVIVKVVNGTGNWLMFDTMRGMGLGTNVKYLQPNTSNAEGGGTDFITPTATGFEINNLGGTQTFIYMAIRRPMKTPESGTEVFAPKTRSGSGAIVTTGAGFTPDVFYNFDRTYGGSNGLFDRLRGRGILQTMSTAVENTTSPAIYDLVGFDTMDGVELGGAYNINMTGSGRNFVDYYFKRATGFMDAVGYNGTGSATTQAHNLGVVPELMIIKRRDGVVHWAVYSAARTSAYAIALESSGAEFSGASYWNGTEPTASVFTVNTHSSVNQSGGTYIAYLFATLAGVSKVGSVVHSGTTNVDCGFSAGARFVLIKRTDASGDWFIWDSSRGISASTDPYVLANSSAAEVTNTDYIDPLSSGFTLTSSFTAGTYIFLAIA